MIEAIAFAVTRSFKRGLPAQVFPNGDEFHFRRDDASPGVVHLRHSVARLRAKRLAAQSGKLFELASGFVERVDGFFDGTIAVVFGFDLAALVLFDIAASDDPLAA